jgi:hypothetical protein
MNEITKKKHAPLTTTEENELKDISENIKFFGKKKAEITFLIGEGLSRARGIFFRHPDGGFEDWLKREFDESHRNAYRYINFFEKFKDLNLPQAAGSDMFSQKVLFILSEPSTSEDVTEEAITRSEAGEKITAKITKELKEKDKENKRLQTLLDAKVIPNIDNLIPGLKSIHGGGSITLRLALIYSQLSEQDQDDILSIEKTKAFKAKEVTILKAEKLELTESANKAHEKADAMQASFDEAVDKTTQDLLTAKDKEIRVAETNAAQATIDAKDKLEKSIRDTLGEKYKDEIAKANKDKEKAQRETSVYQDKNSAMSAKITRQNRELEKVKDRIEVNSPTNIDNARALKMSMILVNIESNISEIETEVRIAGGGMHETKIVIQNIIDKLHDTLDNLEGQTAIDI